MSSTPLRQHLTLACAGVALALLPAAASAQQVYRIVGPDGRVTFSDRPPEDAKAKVEPRGAGGAAPRADADGVAALPFELRQVVSRYPVTLYTSPNCAPCGSGRALLTNRGVPFTEKTISTNEDVAALTRLMGENALPALTIGSQQLRGFSDLEWSKFLDAAGYPRQSVLPRNWRNPPPTPLVQAAQATVPAAAPAPPPTPAPAPAAPPPPPPPAPPPNPAGITF